MTQSGIYILLLIVLALPGCRKTSQNSDVQAVLFQYDYVNYAWGYKHSGFIIDNNGNVLTYNNPEGWNFPENDLELTGDEIEENLSKCNPTGLTISTDELRRYSSYIKNISQSEISAMKNVGADMGTAEYLCYQHSEATGIYKGYLIKMEGDFSCENLNVYSKKVSTWLKGISERIAAP
jgi:hypothetical protein